MRACVRKCITKMTDGKRKGKTGSISENILRIADELVRQVDITKKMIIVMIFIVVIAIPVAWHVAPLLSGSGGGFRAIGYITIVIAAVFLLLGVRQWFILSKWTRKYNAFKEKQRTIDRELDFENEIPGEEK